MVGADRKRLIDSLRQSLEGLALPGEVALRRLPPNVVRADELALDFDNYFTAYRGNFGTELTAQQLAALEQVHQLLAQMSGPGNSSLWSDGAVITHHRWTEVRDAAQRAIKELGWSVPVA